MAARAHGSSSGSTTATVQPPAVVHIVAENRNSVPVPREHEAAVPLPERRVSWDAAAIDNENMNKKKSKKCCIFHKQRPFGESSSDSDSDGNSDTGPAHGSCGEKGECKRGQPCCHHHSNTPPGEAPENRSEA